MGAEFVAGAGGHETGLVYRNLEAGYRLDIPHMFAALLLISLTGLAICAVLALATHLALRHWHESATVAEESAAGDEGCPRTLETRYLGA